MSEISNAAIEISDIHKKAGNVMSGDADKFEEIILELLEKRCKDLGINKTELGRLAGLGDGRKIRFWTSEKSSRKDALKVRELFDLASALQENLPSLIIKAEMEMSARPDQKKRSLEAVEDAGTP